VDRLAGRDRMQVRNQTRQHDTHTRVVGRRAQLRVDLMQRRRQFVPRSRRLVGWVVQSVVGQRHPQRDHRGVRFTHALGQCELVCTGQFPGSNVQRRGECFDERATVDVAFPPLDSRQVGLGDPGEFGNHP
jgi:hypothetical protein